MSKYILIASFLFLALPGLILAETVASPQLMVLPLSPTGVINIAQMPQVTVNYSLNRSQGLFNVDLFKVGCTASKKQICSWSLTKGRYVSLNKKQNCQGDLCNYSFGWALGKKPVKEKGDYYLKVCYLVKNQGLTQVITCATSTNFAIDIGAGKPSAGAINISQMANLWQAISNLLNK